MSTNITAVYDAIISKFEAIFPSKQRLHNPYELSDNPELITKDSWGLKVLSAERTEIEYCNLSVAREFSLLLIRQFATVGNKEDAFDPTTKAILEDQQTALNNLYSPSELGIEEIIDQIEISNINGIEFQQTEQKKYLFTEIGFRVTISEALI